MILEALPKFTALLPVSESRLPCRNLTFVMIILFLPLPETSAAMIPMPGLGAVEPSIVRWLERETAELNLMYPATSKTTIRLDALTQSRKEPEPESLRLVTWQVVPPVPPVETAPKPTAPGKARADAKGASPKATETEISVRNIVSVKGTLRLKPSSSDLLEAKKKELGDLKAFYISRWAIDSGSLWQENSDTTHLGQHRMRKDLLNPRALFCHLILRTETGFGCVFPPIPASGPNGAKCHRCSM